MKAVAAYAPRRLDRTSLRQTLASTDIYRATVWTIAVAQALWLGLLAGRGWYYQDDFTFTAQASGRSPGWGYLTDPVNDHLTPGLRLQFWFFRHVVPLDYDATIVYRALLQVLCTLLLAGLLESLFGRCRLLLFILASYAFSPLVVPGFMWLASATNLLPSQALAIVAVGMHVRFVRNGRLRDAACCGLALFGVALFWEKSATIALVLPILTVAFLSIDPIPVHLMRLAKQWRGLLLEYIPLAGFTGWFFLGGYGHSNVAGSPGATRVLSLIGDAWTHTFAPVLVGGPWHWFAVPAVFVSAGDPAPVAIAIGQLGFVTLALIGMKRLGLRSLLGWLVPAVTMTVGVTVVALGRYRELGGLLTRIYSYSYDIGFPMVLGVCLALLPTRERLAAEPPGARRAPRRPLRIAMAIAAVALLASGAVSSILFVNRWAQSPARDYFHRLEASIRKLPPEASIYDTPASLRVLPYFNPVRSMSDLLPLANLHPRYDGADQEPMFVTDAGSVVPSSFLAASHAEPVVDNPFCKNLVRGTHPLDLVMNRTPGTSEWFLRIEYFRQVFASVTVRVIDADGSTRVPTDGSDIAFRSGIGLITRRLPTMNPARVVLTSDSPNANVCITTAEVGSPLAAHK